RGAVVVVSVLVALLLAATAAQAQSVSSRSVFRTTEEFSLAGRVSCDGSGSGTYTVTTGATVTLVAEGAIEPSGTIQVPVGGEATFTVGGPNTLSLVAGGDVETLFDNDGCSGTLTITPAAGGNRATSPGTSTRSDGPAHADRVSRRVRGLRP
ncbi:MAG TPA: hypothetical protein VIK95_08980, partial [Egibacteraceae bacterium]